MLGDHTITTNTSLVNQQQPMIFPSQNYFPINIDIPFDDDPSMDHDDQEEEQVAENKSCLADVEVKVLGFDAMIKILSRRRPGQLIRTISALEDLQLVILHTNITTIEQTVLYSFTVKVQGSLKHVSF